MSKPNENTTDISISQESTLNSEIPQDVTAEVFETLSGKPVSYHEDAEIKALDKSEAVVNEPLEESQVVNDDHNELQEENASDDTNIRINVIETSQNQNLEPKKLVGPIESAEKASSGIDKVEPLTTLRSSDQSSKDTEKEANIISKEEKELKVTPPNEDVITSKSQRKNEIDDFLKKIDEEDVEIDNYSSDNQNSSESDSDSSDAHNDSGEESSDNEVSNDEEFDEDEDIKEEAGDDIDIDEEDNNSGPITSKNELPEPAAPTLPEDLQIDEKTEISLLGHIFSFSENNLIIKGIASAEYRVIKENAVLCFENRSPIGLIFEIFGPLKSPFYRVKFNGDLESNLNTYKDKKSTKVFYITSGAEFELTNKIMALKGCDASNSNDEEVSENEVEFSDDAEESEFKKSKKKRKRNQNKSKNNNGTEKISIKSNVSEENPNYGLPNLPKSSKKKSNTSFAENNGSSGYSKNFQHLPVPPTVMGNSSFTPNSTNSFKNFLNGGINNMINKEGGPGLNKNVGHNMNFANQNFGMNNPAGADNGSSNTFYQKSFNYNNNTNTSQMPNFNNNPANGGMNHQIIANMANGGQNLNQVAQMIELALKMKQQESSNNSYSNNNTNYDINGNNHFNNNGGFDNNKVANSNNFNSAMNTNFNPNMNNNYYPNTPNNFNPSVNSNMNNNFNSNMNANFNNGMNNFNNNMNNNHNNMYGNFFPNKNNFNSHNNNTNPNTFNSNNGSYNGNGGFNGGANY